MKSQAKDKTNIHADQAEALRINPSIERKLRVPQGLRCISVASGKGGVGKTIVSVNLSHSLSAMGYEVLILDADLGLANIDLQMGLEPKFTVQDVIFGKCSIDDAVIHVDNGPDVLASSSGAPEMVDMGNARRGIFIDELITFAGQYDFFIIDVGAGIGQSIMSFLSASPEVIVVVANEPTSIMDAYSLVKTLCKTERPPSLMMAVNMVRSIDEGELLAERLNKISKRFLNVEIPVASVITYDEAVGNAVRARQAISQYAPNSTTATCIDELARFVASGNNRKHTGSKKTLDKSFFNKFTDIGVLNNTEESQSIRKQLHE